ncbi:MAG TPA: SARP family transcriptional regulator, partial [Pseudonocardiaceae bacterium]|nr:SARP family transcriptional regulator [Pseudonocardiaceae bacterium]
MLATDDLATDLPSVFSWSYRGLGIPAARLFRLLGLHPGSTFRAAAAASVAGVDAASARRALAELCRASLLVEGAPDRYALHDLLQVYAAELASTQETGTERTLATRRMLDHYLRSADAASQLLYRAAEPVTLDPMQPGVTVAAFADREQARGWLAAELPALLAAVRLALEGGFDTQTWQLAWVIAPILEREGRWHDLLATERAALTAASRLGDQF